ncbi:MAG: demethoxyubiquinone hydroxylase family protein [Gammaproteobacteria bacterium]|jgi:ubiquinone biosynthesis monooxygenase Coq7|nr:demethoxyubiquinone hydroxylase family protein [Gammaproteobacteria bacterium]
MLRRLNPLDNLLAEAGHTLKTLFTKKPSPLTEFEHQHEKTDAASLSEHECKHSAGLMRVNHTGEICAQALYRGQAFFARNADIKSHLLKAADEEVAHLNWCQNRLYQLDSHSSYLNVFWYSASFGIGMLAGCVGDAWSLGFVAETEKQVSAHLQDHLERLPELDYSSRNIVSKMLKDEARHAEQALAQGGRELPKPVKMLMRFQSKVMTSTAYFF